MKPKFIMNTAMGIVLTFLLLNGCAELVTGSGGGGSGAQSQSNVRTVPIDGRQADRLKRTMLPLLQATDKRSSASQVRIGLIDDPSINAANAGGGEFYVTTGLLQKASDEQLRGVLAHEIAHDDLGHVAKAQVLGAGLNIGVVSVGTIVSRQQCGHTDCRHSDRQEVQPPRGIRRRSPRAWNCYTRRLSAPNHGTNSQWILSQEKSGQRGWRFLVKPSRHRRPYRRVEEVKFTVTRIFSWYLHRLAQSTDRAVAGLYLEDEFSSGQ